jgi:hypothetical protein
MHADGAGTKSSLAYVYWKETGDLSGAQSVSRFSLLLLWGLHPGNLRAVWRGIAQDAIIMNLDDLICVGATSGFLLSSTIGRNKALIPGEVSIDILIAVAPAIAECSALQCPGDHSNNRGHRKRSCHVALARHRDHQHRYWHDMPLTDLYVILGLDLDWHSYYLSHRWRDRRRRRSRSHDHRGQHYHHTHEASRYVMRSPGLAKPQVHVLHDRSVVWLHDDRRNKQPSNRSWRCDCGACFVRTGS